MCEAKYNHLVTLTLYKYFRTHDMPVRILPAVNFESDLFTGKYRLREKGCAMRNTLNRLVTLTL